MEAMTFTWRLPKPEWLDFLHPGCDGWQVFGPYNDGPVRRTIVSPEDGRDVVIEPFLTLGSDHLKRPNRRAKIGVLHIHTDFHLAPSTCQHDSPQPSVAVLCGHDMPSSEGNAIISAPRGNNLYDEPRKSEHRRIPLETSRPFPTLVQQSGGNAFEITGKVFPDTKLGNFPVPSLNQKVYIQQ